MKDVHEIRQRIAHLPHQFIKSFKGFAIFLPLHELGKITEEDEASSLALIFNLNHLRVMAFSGNMLMGGAAVFGIMMVLTVTNVATTYIAPSQRSMSELVTGYAGLATEVVVN